MKARSLSLSLLAATTLVTAPRCQAATLVVANASFELPALGDGGVENGATIARQGGSGWDLSNSSPRFSGVYNPTSGYYLSAGAQGTPTGAAGAQLSYVFRTGAQASQVLAGSDGIPNNGDDPVLTAQTVYTLTIAVGQRLVGNPSTIDAFGTLSIALLAGSTVIAENNAITGPGAGLFADRTISVNSATLSSALYGQPLTIRLQQLAATDAVADFDNVRLNAVAVPEPSSLLLLSAGIFLLRPTSRRLRPFFGRSHHPTLGTRRGRWID